MSLVSVADQCAVGPGWDSLLCTMTMALMRPYTETLSYGSYGFAAPEVIAYGMGLILSGCGMCMKGAIAMLGAQTSIHPMSIGFVVNMIFLILFFYYKYRMRGTAQPVENPEEPEVVQNRDEATQQLVNILQDNARKAEIRAEGLAAEIQVCRRTIQKREEILRQLGVTNYSTGAPVLQTKKTMDIGTGKGSSSVAMMGKSG